MYHLIPMCCVCLNKGKKIKKLLDSELILLDKLTLSLEFDYLKQDIPLYICYKCNVFLRKMREFQMKFCQSVSTLKDYLKQLKNEDTVVPSCYNDVSVPLNTNAEIRQIKIDLITSKKPYVRLKRNELVEEKLRNLNDTRKPITSNMSLLKIKTETNENQCCIKTEIIENQSCIKTEIIENQSCIKTETIDYRANESMTNGYQIKCGENNDSLPTTIELINNIRSKLSTILTATQTDSIENTVDIINIKQEPEDYIEVTDNKLESNPGFVKTEHC